MGASKDAESFFNLQAGCRSPSKSIKGRNMGWEPACVLSHMHSLYCC